MEFRTRTAEFRPGPDVGRQGYYGIVITPISAVTTNAAAAVAIQSDGNTRENIWANPFE